LTIAEEGLNTLTRTARSSRWIESSAFDLAFFILSPLAGLAVVLLYPVGGPALALAFAALVGGPHYLASFAFYFWEEAAPNHRSEWLAHFVGPALIVAFVAAVAMLRIPMIVVLVIYFWNAYHVSRQSCGILSIYRHRGGCMDVGHKRIVNAAIISTNLCMALWNLEWYPQLHEILALPHPQFPRLLWLTSLVAAIASVAALAHSMHRRQRAGMGATTVEWAFLATSLTLFHPYLWVRDNNLATLAMLMGHFLQYLGIVWLVNRRRADRAPLAHARLFERVWTNPRLLAGTFVLAGSFFLLLQMQALAIAITLVLLHFYLDGIFWAFRRPAVRNLLGPYLTGWKRAP
jgi:hypothetical protein